MKHRWVVAGAAAAAFALAVGCASSEPATEAGTASSTTAGATGTSACTTDAAASDLEATLALVPDDTTTRSWLQIADLQAFLDHQGSELPEDFRDTVWADPVNRFQGTQLLTEALSQYDEDEDPLADTYGIELAQVRRAIHAGMPPDVTEVLVGDFDPTTVEQVVGADPFWSELEERVESNGLTYYAWGDDHELQSPRDGKSAMRPLAIGGRLWAGDHVATRTRADAEMEAFLAVCAGAAPSLADDEDYAGIAQRLDELDGAFQASFVDPAVAATDGGADPGDDSDSGADPGTGSGSGTGWATDRGAPSGSGGRPSGADPSGAEPSAEALEGVIAYGYASGPTDDPDEARILLVFATESEDAAAIDAERFEAHLESAESDRTGDPWSELLRVEDIRTDGRFVVVELLADSTAVVDVSVASRDDLIVLAD
jgi:hypothetical protein